MSSTVPIESCERCGMHTCPATSEDGPVLLDATRHPAGVAAWMLVSGHDVYQLQGVRIVRVLDPDDIGPSGRYLLTHQCPPEEASP